MLFDCHPKILNEHSVFSFSWGHLNSQARLKTMLLQNFGVTNKEYYRMLWYFQSGQLLANCLGVINIGRFFLKKAVPFLIVW